MKIVGDKLRDIALVNAKKGDEDAFGRSAFNRYYYSAFLITRSLMKRRRDEWGRVAHSNLPDIVRKAGREINEKLTFYRKKGLVHGTLSGDATEGISATKALAGLLEEAYEVRVKADYTPEDSIRRHNDDLLLGNTTLSDAGRWSAKAHHLCNQIENAWRQLGII